MATTYEPLLSPESRKDRDPSELAPQGSFMAFLRGVKSCSGTSGQSGFNWGAFALLLASGFIPDGLFLASAGVMLNWLGLIPWCCDDIPDNGAGFYFALVAIGIICGFGVFIKLMWARFAYIATQPCYDVKPLPSQGIQYGSTSPDGTPLESAAERAEKNIRICAMIHSVGYTAAFIFAIIAANSIRNNYGINLDVAFYLQIFASVVEIVVCVSIFRDIHLVKLKVLGMIAHVVVFIVFLHSSPRDVCMYYSNNDSSTMFPLSTASTSWRSSTDLDTCNIQCVSLTATSSTYDYYHAYGNVTSFGIPLQGKIKVQCETCCVWKPLGY